MKDWGHSGYVKLAHDQYLYLHRILDMAVREKEKGNQWLLSKGAINRIIKIIKDKEYNESDSVWLNRMKRTYLKYN